MSVLLVQNLPHEGEGVLGAVLTDLDVTVSRWRAWETPDALPDLDAHDGLVVLGGDMNTDEDDIWPHLHLVRHLLVDAVERDLPTLGLCLGAQLLAESTGGSVHHGTPEIGYIEIARTEAGDADPVLSAVADRTRFFNAHADQITMPPDGVLLASSTDTPVHAFRVGSAVGLQFHPEIDAAFVRGYVVADGVEDYLRANGWTPDELVAAAEAIDQQHRQTGYQLLAAWVEQAELAD